jgi:ligand-binding sensor domain-containing protein/signal transduction histidine kinase
MGLASSEVNAVIQDEDGYIWTGTSDGLQRFDGTRFKTFRHNPADPLSIPANLVRQLMLDHKKNLWILTGDGKVGIFDTRTFRFREASVKLKIPEAVRSSIKRLVMDDRGNIFFLLAGNEVVTWNEKLNEFSYTHNFFSIPPGKQVADFVHQPGTDKYWIAIQGEGIAIYDAGTRRLQYQWTALPGEAPSDLLYKIDGAYNLHFDKKGRLWLQRWGAGFPEVFCYDLRETSKPPLKFEFITELKTYYETYRFFEQPDSTLWITGLGVFARYLEKEKKFQLVHNGYLNERSILYEKVIALMQDKEKNIWVGTDNNGLYRFNPSQQYFTNISHTNRITGLKGQGSIMSVVPTRYGTLLVGSWGDGIYQYDRNLNLLPTNIKGIDNKLGPSAWSFCASADSNTIWISAQPGIYAFDQSRRAAVYYNPPVLQNKTVRQVAEDKQGNLWIGMQGIGVFKWNAEAIKKKEINAVHRVESVPVVQINKITIDHKGYVWIATSTSGVYVVDPTTEKILLRFGKDEKNEFRLPEEGVSSVLEYDKTRMVITTGRQVILYNRMLNQSLVLGSPEIVSGFIAAVEKDKKGYLWISTTMGIYRVNIRNRVFVGFNRDDGIDNDHFILAASAQLPDGRLVFGSTTQFVIFDPAAIDVDIRNPEVKITDFRVMNKSLVVDSLLKLKQVELRHNNNSLVVEFSSLMYSSACLVLYKLEGLDKDWNTADKNNQAIYSYLPPGKYTFLLKTISPDGNEGTKITRVPIRVNAPFWKSWWFYSLLALLTGILLFWFDRERMKRKEAILKMRGDIAGNLHEQVSTALNNINILSEMARLKADKDTEKSKEYLEQIHTKSHSMIIALDDMLWTLDPENDSMVKTTERMREYIDALKNRYGVNINMEVDKKVESLVLNMKLRHEAFLVFKEGIKNLVTVGATNCNVYISLERGYLLFTTQFDHQHCDMQQLNNLLHRQDLEKKLKDMQASIDVQVHKTNSVITLEVPVS